MPVRRGRFPEPSGQWAGVRLDATLYAPHTGVGRSLFGMNVALPRPPHPHPAMRRLGQVLVATIVLLATAVWTWRQPFMEWPRTLWELSRMPPPNALPVPVQGVAAGDIAATFGAPRSGDRTHDGIDIFAARGTPVLSATRGVVLSVREGGIGGRQVWVIGPSRERHYYAHLDDWSPGLQRGDVLRVGDTIGTVGNTGNARGTPTHLHYGTYGAPGAFDPLPRLRAGSGLTAVPAGTHRR